LVYPSAKIQMYTILPQVMSLRFLKDSPRLAGGGGEVRI
jgi:hypothetical protein